MFKKNRNKNINCLTEKFRKNINKKELIYKYAHCYALGPIEWISIAYMPLPKSQKEWEQEIYNKYKNFPKEDLEGLYDYLNLRSRVMNNFVQGNQLIIPMFMTAIITYFMDGYFEALENLDYSMPLSAVIMYTLIIIALLFFVVVTYKFVNGNTEEDKVTEFFYQDYGRVIKKILDEK